MIKPRMEDPATRAVTGRVVAYVLDNILRLLHPITPFLTEEIWQLLGTVAPKRGLTMPVTAAEAICVAAWPQADTVAAGSRPRGAVRKVSNGAEEHPGDAQPAEHSTAG